MALIGTWPESGLYVAGLFLYFFVFRPLHTLLGRKSSSWKRYSNPNLDYCLDSLSERGALHTSFVCFDVTIFHVKSHIHSLCHAVQGHYKLISDKAMGRITGCSHRYSYNVGKLVVECWSTGWPTGSIRTIWGPRVALTGKWLLLNNKNFKINLQSKLMK